jgi:hypothetical protein
MNHAKNLPEIDTAYTLNVARVPRIEPAPQILASIINNSVDANSRSKKLRQTRPEFINERLGGCAFARLMKRPKINIGIPREIDGE